MDELSSNRASTDRLKTYLEVGYHRTMAAALEWPGWCRLGRDEASALQILFDYAPRYARILRSSHLDFQVPSDVSAFRVVERLKGNAVTDYGVPGLIPSQDALPPDAAELGRLQAILKACWRRFDSTVKNADGKALRTGPRGGGRNLVGIVRHVHEAELAYLSKLGGTLSKSEASPEMVHRMILVTLEASAHGEVPEKGPRGGRRWPARYFTRRAAWHVLDHLWEVEDRLME